MQTVLLRSGRTGLTHSQEKCLALTTKHLRHTAIELQDVPDDTDRDLLGFLRLLVSILLDTEDRLVGEALSEAFERCVTSEEFGGYGMPNSSTTEPISTSLSLDQEKDVLFLCSAYLEAFENEERVRNKPAPLADRPAGRRSMTMTEKIFAAHDTTRRGEVKPGDIIQVDVDWILASEISWQGMETVYESVGRPGIFRNDRFWLAGDHRVEPELYDTPKVRKLMNTSIAAKEDFKMTDFQGFNYTIMHTEFVRERAQPGMLCIGADSHSCSAGAVSCLSIGMGASDVCMPLITGQTWFTVPKTVNIRFVGRPMLGVSGKDTILYILGIFKRNTIAAERVVEFTGPGLEHLSCDARFAIANMCTEFGAVTGIFEADDRTYDFIQKRRLKKHRSGSVYYRPDEDAEYEASYTVDLSLVEPFVAKYPSPDDVVPVSDVAGTKLDGVFIGACTTAEEDLVTAALILKAGLSKGLKLASGRRVVVPGSKPIRHKLQQLGLLDVYTAAGFKIGVPGCSMCIGQGMDQARPNEVWLSSQNRNFPNRMGPGSIANLSSAATVAASAFDMTITSPRALLESIDVDYLHQCLGLRWDAIKQARSPGHITYCEPYGDAAKTAPESQTQTGQSQENGHADERRRSPSPKRKEQDPLVGRVLRLGEFIDTDAIIPSAFLAGSTTNESLGQHCMEYFMPEFRSRVQSGQNIVVAGEGFGCGSSRDVAVNALLGCGVQCVIAKSFSFIYARNQPNIGLLGIVMPEERFYDLATEGKDITVDLDNRKIVCSGESFSFQLSEVEEALIEAGGLTEAFKKFGKDMFNVLCRRKSSQKNTATIDIEAIKA